MTEPDTDTGSPRRGRDDGRDVVPTTLGAAGDHDVDSGFGCARSGPKVTDLGGRGDTRVVRAPDHEKSYPKLTGSSAGLATIAAVSSWARSQSPMPPADAEQAAKLAQVPQLLIELQCATGATDPDHAQPIGTRDRCRQRPPATPPSAH